MQHSSVNQAWTDEFNAHRQRWARFSFDREGPDGTPRFRYRLGRSLNPDRPLIMSDKGVLYFGAPFAPATRIVFLMLNPSTADALDDDPTIRECCKRAKALGAGILEVVNLFALRSPHPQELKKYAHGYRGDDSINNHQIMEACGGANMVIAAWGNDGDLGSRDRFVCNLLMLSNVELYHLGTTKDGYPKHPLARGKHRIPAQQAPIRWVP